MVFPFSFQARAAALSWSFHELASVRAEYAHRLAMTSNEVHM
jgi:hypothetical protein